MEYIKYEIVLLTDSESQQVGLQDDGHAVGRGYRQLQVASAHLF